MFRYLLLSISLFSASALADTTTGGIIWKDALGYTKPGFVPITVPNEASATKYYIDLNSGGGSTCSSASPCSAFSALVGKAGMSTGPAYV